MHFLEHIRRKLYTDDSINRCVLGFLFFRKHDKSGFVLAYLVLVIYDPKVKVKKCAQGDIILSVTVNRIRSPV